MLHPSVIQAWERECPRSLHGVRGCDTLVQVWNARVSAASNNFFEKIPNQDPVRISTIDTVKQHEKVGAVRVGGLCECWDGCSRRIIMCGHGLWIVFGSAARVVPWHIGCESFCRWCCGGWFGSRLIHPRHVVHHQTLDVLEDIAATTKLRDTAGRRGRANAGVKAQPHPLDQQYVLLPPQSSHPHTITMHVHRALRALIIFLPRLTSWCRIVRY
jgi:hypothetical protein